MSMLMLFYAYFICRVKTEVKHASTPLKVNLKMQLQKAQLEDQQKRNTFQHQQRPAVTQSTAINMPITVQALKSDLPANIVQVRLSSLRLMVPSIWSLSFSLASVVYLRSDLGLGRPYLSCVPNTLDHFCVLMANDSSISMLAKS